MEVKCRKCNSVYPENTLECENCGNVLTETQNSQEEELGKPKVTLISLVGNSRIEIPEDGVFIKRGSELNPILNSMKISETHCRIIIEDSECYVEDIGSSGVGSKNGTILNGSPLPARERIRFKNGDALRIAHLTFDIVVEYPQRKSKDSLEDEKDAADVRKWVIRCPVSQRKFEVEGPDTRIDECACCVDSIDKRRISDEKPKQARA